MPVQEKQDKILEAIEVAKKSGKIVKGTNEVTKAIERGIAKLVVIADDVDPREIIMHLPVICEEHQVMCVHIPKKDDLGAAAGLQVGTASVAIVKEGEAVDMVRELSKHGKEGK